MATKRIYADVDEALYRAFQVRLAEAGRKMAPVIRELVKRYLEEGNEVTEMQEYEQYAVILETEYYGPETKYRLASLHATEAEARKVADEYNAAEAADPVEYLENNQVASPHAYVYGVNDLTGCDQNPWEYASSQEQDRAVELFREEHADSMTEEEMADEIDDPDFDYDGELITEAMAENGRYVVYHYDARTYLIEREAR